MENLKFYIGDVDTLIEWADALTERGIGCIGGQTPVELSQDCINRDDIPLYGFVTVLHKSITFFEYSDTPSDFTDAGVHREITIEEFLSEAI